MGKKFSGIDEILRDDSNREQEITAKVKTTSDEKMITTSYRIKASLHKKLKITAIELGLKEHEVLAQALEQYFGKI